MTFCEMKGLIVEKYICIMKRYQRVWFYGTQPVDMFLCWDFIYILHFTIALQEPRINFRVWVRVNGTSRGEPRPNIVYTHFHFQVEDNR